MARTLVVWCPDWPVRAVRHSGVGIDLPQGAPVALFEHGEVRACSASARRDGVRRGQRMRDAQARCPELVTLDYDPGLDVRAFEPIVAAIEEIAPGVQPLRPGTCAVRVAGPGRYFGGEQHAAAVLAERLVEHGVDDVRLGIADAVFAAEQAARQAVVQDSVVVPPGESAAFLADLPVGVLERPALVSLLQRLGLRTLGAFAALRPADVLTRFGPDGALAHRLARGVDDRPFAARRPPSDLEREVTFEPPLEDAEAVAFSVRRTAEAFVAGLAERQLVCTSVWVEVQTDRGETTERQWLHPRWFDAGDLVDRVRWQLQARPGAGGVVSAVSAPVSGVKLVPADVAPVSDHAEGLWGSGPDARVHRAASKVQSILGREAVVSAVVGGGRGPADRRTLVPWGDPLVPERAVAPPWPGGLPAPAPATVYDPPRPARVVGASGQPVMVSDRGMVTAAPAQFGSMGLDTAQTLQPVAAWAGPWPVDERWWDTEQAVRAARFQVVGVDGSAWLLRVSDGVWCVEARYD
ncbi:DNA polymerase Y family protein [Mumia zhuanghuii]|uniref:DNA polymerase Y family protein n=2 Tax=Mumia TaxID=1546255 RepID=A0ABW1QRH8_9ACTN|nr:MULTISPECIES: DNA polymerase Y family protein [Mumia]KAA1420373.1 DNA polymerase Y family protein [Mumia zhuanghuii]